MSDSLTPDLQDDLRELITSSEFRRLEAKLAPFNTFEAAGVVHQEERHSDFLAYLMRPREAHGLGDRFLRSFLVGAIEEIRETSDASPCHPLEVDLLDLSQARVEREWGFANVSGAVDLLVRIPDEEFGDGNSNGLVVVIENKVKAGETTDQLERYRVGSLEDFDGYELFLVYLTPDGRDANEEMRKHYHSVSYAGTVLPALQTLTASEQDGPPSPVDLPSRVERALQDYESLLRRHVVDESKVGELCRKILDEHHEALERLWEYREDPRQQMLNVLEDIIGDDGKLTLQHRKGSMVRCVPERWVEHPAVPVDREDPVLAIKISIDKNGTGGKIYLRIREGDEDARDAIWQRATSDMSYKHLAGDLEGTQSIWQQPLRGEFEVFHRQDRERRRIELKDSLESALTNFWSSIAPDVISLFETRAQPD